MESIRLATMDDLKSVVNILNQATLKLLNLGIQQWEYPWDAELIQNHIGHENCYVLLTGNEIIGTFFLDYIDSLSNLSIELKSLYLSKIAVHPSNQGRNVGASIVRFAQSHSRRLHKTLYRDCWDGNDKLKSFYSQNGFEDIGRFPENDYWIRIFRFRDEKSC